MRSKGEFRRIQKAFQTTGLSQPKQIRCCVFHPPQHVWGWLSRSFHASAHQEKLNTSQQQQQQHRRTQGNQHSLWFLSKIKFFFQKSWVFPGSLETSPGGCRFVIGNVQEAILNQKLSSTSAYSTFEKVTHVTPERMSGTLGKALPLKHPCHYPYIDASKGDGFYSFMFTGSSPTLGEVDIQLCWNMVNLVNSLSRKTQIELELSPGNLRYDVKFFPPIHFTFAWTTWMPPVNSCKWAHCMVADLLMHGAPSTWRQEIFRFFRKGTTWPVSFLGHLDISRLQQVVMMKFHCNKTVGGSTAICYQELRMKRPCKVRELGSGQWNDGKMNVVAIELLSQNAKLNGAKISEFWGLQFAVLILCFRDCMLAWAAKRCRLHPHTHIQCGQLCSLYCIQQFLLGAFLKIRNPTKKSVVFWFQKLWILTILVILWLCIIHGSLWELSTLGYAPQGDNLMPPLRRSWTVHVSIWSFRLLLENPDWKLSITACKFPLSDLLRHSN